MKKFISLLLIMTMVLSLAACGGSEIEDTTENTEVVTNEGQDTTETEENDVLTEEQTGTDAEELENTVTEGETEEPAANEVEQENTENEDAASSSAPQTKPEEAKKPEQNSSNTAEQKPVVNSKPEKEETKKEETKKEDTKEDNKKEENKKEDTDKEDSKENTASATVGQTLLSVFKKNAASKSAQELADMLITNEVILFMGGSMPVEPGLLSGFDNTEITGFKEGVMFSPMMGSIAFVGYVFEVEDGTDVNAFMKTLKDSANPRWQICVEAEETIVDAVGNKVFFLMSPRSLEQ